MNRFDLCLDKSVTSLRVSSLIWTLFSHMITGLFYLHFFTHSLIWGLHLITGDLFWFFLSTIFWCKCLFLLLLHINMNIYCHNLIFYITLKKNFYCFSFFSLTTLLVVMDDCFMKIFLQLRFLFIQYNFYARIDSIFFLSLSFSVSACLL